MNRRAEKAGVYGKIRVHDLWMVERSQATCHYCGITLEVGTFDHVVPFDRGGPNQFFNIVRCCLTCNRNKYTKTPEQLAESQVLEVSCEICGKRYKPRWAEYQAGRARLCSRSCSARKSHRCASR
jgi:transcription elongation factor Elf1